MLGTNMRQFAKFEYSRHLESVSCSNSCFSLVVKALGSQCTKHTYPRDVGSNPAGSTFSAASCYPILSPRLRASSRAPFPERIPPLPREQATTRPKISKKQKVPGSIPPRSTLLFLAIPMCFFHTQAPPQRHSGTHST